MRNTSKPFFDLTAMELMSRQVVMVPQEMSLRTAAHLLSQAEVSGAPVVDATGRCVGVLSATDFMHHAETGEAARAAIAAAEVGICSEWQVVDFEMLPTEEVREFMTADPVTVPPTASIGELAQRMLDAHIHRLIVVDPDRKPIGVVSTTDILAAVAFAQHRNAFQETRHD
jgi:CBS-domain-containing membrane protein